MKSLRYQRARDRDVSANAELIAGESGSRPQQVPDAGMRTEDRDVRSAVAIVIRRDRTIGVRAEDVCDHRSVAAVVSVPAAIGWTEHGVVSLAVAVVIGRNRNVSVLSPVSRSELFTIRARGVPPVSGRWPEDREITLTVAIEITDERLITGRPERFIATLASYAAKSIPGAIPGPEDDKVRFPISVEVRRARDVSAPSELI